MTNLKVSVRDGKTCEKILKIEVLGDDIQKEYDQYYKAIAPKAKVPGFRPGKAPRNVLVMHYGNEARESVLKNLLSESYRTALQEKSIHPLGYPEIKEVDFKDEKLSYEATVEIRPKIKLSKVSGISAKKEKPEIKEEEMNEALTRLRESFGQFKAIEDRPAQLGDFVIADYVCVMDGKEIEKRNDDWFELKEDEFLKGFSTQLVGAQLGSEKEVTITFPETLQRKEMAGKTAIFKMKVKEIKSKTLPELNDDLAKEAGEFKTLDELKDKIRTDLMANKEHESEAKYEKALLDELVKLNKVELPAGIVHRRLDHLVDDAIKHFHRHGNEPDDKEIREKLHKELEPEAKKQVHLAFLLDEIATQEKLTVADEDLKLKYKTISEQVHQGVDAVEKYYKEHPDAVDALHDQILNEKAIEFIKKNAKE